MTAVEVMKWSNSEFVWKRPPVGFADGLDVKYEMKKDLKMTSCLEPEQLEGWRKAKFED